ncbi:hypothetical protein JSY14_04880 [Brachybacterium sp. EF45031]|uniref:PH domain-containing protein n=1 Tax=Brachybacterium sillae TaxID=2810536 RepID=UPI00217DC9B4|nr:PH domain-containing protein [Brachybacterium sillae]MCS6711386.1 hypothetical protein [Brachybacterium sillae]
MIRLRPRLSTGTCLVLWGLSAVLVLDAVLRAGVRALPYTAPVLLLCAVAWWGLWRPQVIIDDATRSVTVRNVLSTWHLPYGSIRELTLRSWVRLRVRVAGGRETSISAWNAPGQGPRSTAVSPLDRDWLRWEDGPEDAVAHRTWNVLPLAVVAALAVLTVLSTTAILR